jgi:hypothetical protein
MASYFSSVGQYVKFSIDRIKVKKNLMFVYVQETNQVGLTWHFFNGDHLAKT